MHCSGLSFLIKFHIFTIEFEKKTIIPVALLQDEQMLMMYSLSNVKKSDSKRAFAA